MSDLVNTPEGQIFVGVMITSVSASLIGMYNYFKNRLHCIDVVADKTSKNEARSIRQSKAMILMAQILDGQTNFHHPDHTPSNLASEVEKLLQDERGNL